MRFSLIAVLVAAFLLAGCGSSLNQTAVTATDQQDAGITKAVVHFNDNGQLKDVTLVDGKERGDVSLDVDLTKKRLRYEARDVRSFDGQKFRNEAEKAFAASESETVKSIGPDIIDAILKAFTAL